MRARVSVSHWIDPIEGLGLTAHRAPPTAQQHAHDGAQSFAQPLPPLLGGLQRLVTGWGRPRAHDFGRHARVQNDVSSNLPPRALCHPGLIGRPPRYPKNATQRPIVCSNRAQSGRFRLAGWLEGTGAPAAAALNRHVIQGGGLVDRIDRRRTGRGAR